MYLTPVIRGRNIAQMMKGGTGLVVDEISSKFIVNLLKISNFSDATIKAYEISESLNTVDDVAHTVNKLNE